METFEQLLLNWEIFFLVVIRVSAIFIIAPIFGSQNIPANIKVLVPFTLSAILFPFIPTDHLKVEKSLLSLAIIATTELGIGLIISFVADVIFEVFQFGGFLLGRQMGFEMVNIVDPQTQDEMSIISFVQTLIATLIFIIINGHHMIILVLEKSFHIIPISTLTFRPELATSAISLTSRLFTLSFMFSLPVYGALIIANVLLGVVAKAIPEIQVFLLQLPLKIAIGLGGLVILMPVFVQMAHWLFNIMFDQFEIFLELMT